MEHNFAKFLLCCKKMMLFDINPWSITSPSSFYAAKKNDAFWHKFMEHNFAKFLLCCKKKKNDKFLEHNFAKFLLCCKKNDAFWHKFLEHNFAKFLLCCKKNDAFWHKFLEHNFAKFLLCCKKLMLFDINSWSINSSSFFYAPPK